MWKYLSLDLLIGKVIAFAGKTFAITYLDTIGIGL